MEHAPARGAADRDEAALLRSAADGDEQAFGELTGAYRREIQVHC